MKPKRILELFATSGDRWLDDKCYRLGASLAYYAIFSLFPLALLALTIFGFVLGSGPDARAHILSSLDPGTPEGRAILDQTLTALQSHRTARGVGAVIAFLTLLFGASGVFSELDTSINQIWRCKEKKTNGIWESIEVTVKDKAISFLLVAVAGLLLLASVVASTAISAITTSASSVIPFAWLWDIVELVVSCALLTGIFAMMYRYIPRCRAAWGDVLFGAAVTSVLFTILKRLLTWYLAHIGSYAAYGAVGGMLGLLTWIYVVSLLVFFGAELTRVWAEKFGSLKDSARAEDESHDVQHEAEDPGHGTHAHSIA